MTIAETDAIKEIAMITPAPATWARSNARQKENCEAEHCAAAAAAHERTKTVFDTAPIGPYDFGVIELDYMKRQ